MLPKYLTMLHIATGNFQSIVMSDEEGFKYAVLLSIIGYTAISPVRVTDIQVSGSVLIICLSVSIVLIRSSFHIMEVKLHVTAVTSLTFVQYRTLLSLKVKKVLQHHVTCKKI